MAYIPTIEDVENIDSKSVYQPTIEDINDIDRQNEKPGMFKTALQTAGQTGIGALQGISEVGHGIGDLETRLVNSIFGTKLQSPAPDLYSATGVSPSIASKVGELGGQIAGGGALVGALSPLIGIPAAMGATGATTTDGDVKDRALSGVEGAVIGKVAKSLPEAFKYFKKHSSPKEMGKLLDKYSSTVNDTSKKLYGQAYKGTGQAKPVISPAATEGFKDILQRVGTSKIKGSVKAFKKDPTLSNYHGIRKDVQGTIRGLESKAEKSGLGGADEDLINSLKRFSGNIDKDLEKGFSRLHPEKYDQFKDAQAYHKKYKIPLKKYKSVRDYLGEEKTISKALTRDLSKDETTAKFLREQLGLDKKALDTLKSPIKPSDITAIGKFELLKKLLGG
jgi:hypothetical protein